MSEMKVKKMQKAGYLFGIVCIVGVTLVYLGNTFGATNTNTTLGITAGVFSFTKDVGIAMDSYFSHSGNTAATVDIGTYGASVTTISARSSGDHRFRVNDLLGTSFTVTLQSSNLTASGVVAQIQASATTYTGSDRLGTGSALTATGTQSTALDSPVTFVARANALGLSDYAQEITLKVAVPGASPAGSYTGVLTFTY